MTLILPVSLEDYLVLKCSIYVYVYKFKMSSLLCHIFQQLVKHNLQCFSQISLIFCQNILYICINSVPNFYLVDLKWLKWWELTKLLKKWTPSLCAFWSTVRHAENLYFLTVLINSLILILFYLASWDMCFSSCSYYSQYSQPVSLLWSVPSYSYRINHILSS